MMKKFLKLATLLMITGSFVFSFSNTDDNVFRLKYKAEELQTYNVSDYYGGYYSSVVSWTDGEDLKNQLHDLIRNGYTALDYNWDVNKTADQSLYDLESVDVVYSSSCYLKTETVTNNYGWNREHCFCASLMTGKSTSNATKQAGRATDYHNLMAADYSGNSSRGNKNYGVADTSASGYKSFLNAEGTDGYSYDTKNFEPSDKDKGRTARAIFYMGTMYKDDETEGTSSYKGLTIQEDYVDYDSSDCAFAIGNLSTLLSWNSFDVDRLEYQHNESVYSTKINGTAQGNRNPYVDYPELVDYVYGSKKDQPGELKYLKPSYEKLNIASDEFSNYAVLSAKRNYYVDDAVSVDDYKIVAVKNDYSYEDYNVTEYEYAAFTSGQIGKTSVNLYVNDDLYIPINVIISDGHLDHCSYTVSEMSPSSGGVLNSIKESPGVNNEVNLNGIDWVIYYEKGKIVSLNSSWGTQFGTTSLPCQTVSFETKEEFAFDNYNAVNAVYARLNAGSGASYKVKILIGDTQIYEGDVIYNLDSSLLYGTTLAEPLKGKVKIVLYDISAKACYIDAIGINGVHVVDPPEIDPVIPVVPDTPVTSEDEPQSETSNTSSKKKNNMGLIIGLSVAGAVILIAVIVLIVIFVL